MGRPKLTTKATVHVKDLGMFVTVQLLDDTPAELSLGTLCEEHGYSCEWTEGQTPNTLAHPTTTCLLLLVYRLKPAISVQSMVIQLVHSLSKLEPGDQEAKQASRNRLEDLPEWLE